jgi:dTDP-4-amino-4,6-dideoxygalactose transaminase
MTTLSAVNDLARHNAALADELSAAVTEVVRGGWYVLGRRVAAFEEAFADFCGAPHAVGVASGTDALELALAAVGVGRGDRVALVANAGGYGTTAVLALGADPVYVDVDPETSTMDPRALHTAGDVRAVVVTHLYGRVADVAAITHWARRAGVKVVEDCAQAHGAARDGRGVGTWGDAGAFSFYPTKNLGALGDGGAVVTRDPQVAERVRGLRQYGWQGRYRQTLPHGRNSRLDEMQAAVLLVKLPHLAGWTARRVAVADGYRELITHPKVTLPDPGGVAHLFVVSTQDRDGLSGHLRERGVPHDVHFPVPDHRQPVHAGRYAGLRLPVTERLCREVLTLPCFPEMTSDEVGWVAATVNEWGC